MKPLRVEEVLYLHYRIAKQTGGRYEVRSPALLGGAVARPFAQVRGQDVYPTPFDKAAVLLVGIISCKPFYDCNDTAAVGAALLLLQRFGFKVKANPELPGLAAAVADGMGDWRRVAAWLREHSRPKEDAAAGC
ncbi:MAG: Fic family protein [Bacillota bacterium]